MPFVRRREYSRERPNVSAEPHSEIGSLQETGSGGYDHTFLFIHRSLDLTAVEHQERFHGRVADPLVAVQKWMVAEQRKTQSRGLIHQRFVQVGPTKGRPRLSQG
jgi:hypothetical protein